MKKLTLRNIKKDDDSTRFLKPPKSYTAKDIKELRKKLNLSQALFAKLCNINLVTLRRWEQGVSKPFPPVFRLFDICAEQGIKAVLL